MSVELTPDVLSLLAGMQSTLQDVRAELTAVRSELHANPIGSAKPREFFSVEEVAKMIGKSAYTVRQWANQGRIYASKRSERRGGAALWSISADEIVRYQDEGLLAIDISRNAKD